MFESYLIVTNHYLCLFRTCEIQAGIETSPSLLSFWGGGGWVTLGRLGTPIFSLTVQESRPLPQLTREGLDLLQVDGGLTLACRHLQLHHQHQGGGLHGGGGGHRGKGTMPSPSH